MKKILLFLIVIASATSGFGQVRKLYGNSAYFIQPNYSLGIVGGTSTDTTIKFMPTFTKLYYPELVPRYNTAGMPSASAYAGCWVYNTDSNKMYYSNASAWTDPANSIAPGAVTSVSAGLGMSFTTISTAGPVKLDTSYAMTLNTTQASTGAKNFYGAVNLFGGGNAYINGGNSFGAAANIGTKDNNQINVIVNAANAISIFGGGSVRIGAGGVTGSQKLTVDGTIGIAGTLTVNANSGVSVLSGFNFSSFAANNASNNIGFGWGMNNPYTSGTKVFTNIAGDNSLASGTSSVKQIAIIPTYTNSGSGTYTEWGIYYNPTLTSMINTTHIAWENVSGDMKFNTTSGVSSFFGKANFAVPTASIASINLAPSSAIDPSSPSVGDLWYNGTNLNFRKTGGTTVDLLAGGGGSSQPFSTATALFKDGTDPTKLLNFNISGFTTATTRNWVFPNASGTVARIDAGQSFVGAEDFTGANLSVASQASSNAGFKLNSGTLLGTTQAGALENDGTHLYFSFSNGGTRYQLDQQSGGGGITSLNTLTGSTQTFAPGTSGTDFGINSVGTTHTFNIPDASNTARGLITIGTQNINGVKTFSNPPKVINMTQGASPDSIVVRASDGTLKVVSSSNPLNVNDVGSGRPLQYASGDSLHIRSLYVNGAVPDTLSNGGVNIITGTSGVYKPTVANVLNTGSVLVDSFFYQQIGRVVHVSGYVTAIVSSNNAATEISFTLPVSATLGANDLYGVCTIQNPDGSYSAAIITRNSSDHTKGSIAGKCGAGTTSTEITYFRFECTYKAF